MGVSAKPLAMALMVMATTVVHAETIEVTMNLVSESGVGEKIGVVKVEDSKHGVILTPDLKDLEPGLHGFHVHEKPDCGPGEKDGKPVAALAAGGHLKGDGKDAHEGPYGEGHIGDLPAIYVDQEGRATHPVLAPRIKTDDIKGRALMVHKGGDNYSDKPESLGGGGSRMACGVIGEKDSSDS